MTPDSTALLADGAMITVRPLRATDLDAVATLHRRLNERDRYLRFFTLNPANLDKLAGTMVEGAGLGAFRDDDLVGVAHYHLLPEKGTAEVALAIDGTAQAHGVGTLLLEHLVSLALTQGVRRFVAVILAENTRMARVFSDLGLPCTISNGGPEREVELTLGGPDEYMKRIEERERVADVASLRAVLTPASVAVIGAGRRADSVGRAILHNLIDAGYEGELHVVNPNAPEILGVPSVPTLSDIGGAVELVVVCVPADAVLDVVEECGRQGVRAIVLVTAGLTGTPAGERVREAVRRHGMRLVGPNCFGVANTSPAARLDTTFARGVAPRGRIGVVTQSGGFGIALLESLGALGLGVSTMVSTGDKYDVSGNDLLRWWRRDTETDIAVLYLESFGNPRKFSRLARTLAREKPVVAIRGAETAAAQRAAAAHTSSSFVPAATKLALFDQAGVLVADSVTEVIGLLAALSWQPLPAGDRVAVVSNAGGAAVLGAQACSAHGLDMPELGPDTIAALRGLLPGHASIGNPLDTSAAVTPDTFAACVAAVLADDAVDTVITAGVPTGVGDPLTAVARTPGQEKPLLMVRLGQLESVTEHHGVPSYGDVEEAAWVAAKLAARARWLSAGEGAVPDLPGIDLSAATLLVDDYYDSHSDGGWMSIEDSRDLVRCFGIAFAKRRDGDRELIVRAQADDIFGTMVVLGLGGVDEALLDDRVTGLGPLTTTGADTLIDGLRCSESLFSTVNGSLDRDAVRDILLRVGRLTDLLPDVVDVDLDPVLVSEKGAAAGGARILVRRRRRPDPYLRALRD
ncbi:GNAT family N-acetyltransferase [Amycolatopsis sp. lyj-108]|uniref:bifunctional acetate--CoA ligase family protein/GNAT family N-acetyltransferase n=1 Tax=Amycolatopsis sp. lyj-108 TaxID=2789286 RepID=UPI003979A6D3